MSMLKFIDISSWNSVETAAMDGIDGVIVKTTQGTQYVNPKADGQYQLAKKKGRLLGIYHYAEGSDPVAEAEYFYKHSKGYIGEAVPFLDWEAGENRSWGDFNWCRKFVDHFHKISGVWCGIYIQASAIPQVANLANTCALWVAGYPTRGASWDIPSFIYNIKPWSAYTLWQFTDGGSLDKNVANITVENWKKIADPNKSNPTLPVTPQEPNTAPYSLSGKNIEQMATDTMNGLTGAGDTRKKCLGKYYAGVQAIINERLKVISGSTCHNVLTQETLNGYYGNGKARKHMLGNYYQVVQNKINQR